MNLLSLSLKNIRSKPLNTFLSVLLFALGTALVSLMLGLQKQVSDKLDRNLAGINLVLGAKGSELQNILSAVYHIDVPTGNIPLKDGQAIARIKSLIEKAIPQALGDNYKGFRIVGTTHEYPEIYKATLASGKLWEADMEAVIGSTVAQKSGLKIGDTFAGAHGLTGEIAHNHEEYLYKVTGILKPSKTVMDQLILTNVASVWKVHEEHDHEEGEEGHHEDEHHDSAHDHDHGAAPAQDTAHHHDADHDHEADHAHEKTPPTAKTDTADHAHEAHADEAPKEITSYLIFYKKDKNGNPSTMADIQLPMLIDQNFPKVGYARPLRQIYRLLDITGVGINSLWWIGVIFIFVSAFSVFVSLYSSLKARRFELAQMRVMGASPIKLFSMIILEGLMIAFIGYLFGVLLSHTAMAVMANRLEDAYQYTFSGFFYFQPHEIIMLGVALALGFVAALIPALQAYTVKISKTLSDN